MTISASFRLLQLVLTLLLAAALFGCSKKPEAPGADPESAPGLQEADDEPGVPEPAEQAAPEEAEEPEPMAEPQDLDEEGLDDEQPADELDEAAEDDLGDDPEGAEEEL